MFFSSFKGINRLINEGMSRIYLRVTTEKNRLSQNFDLWKCVSRSILGELQLTQISLNFKTSCWNLNIKGLGAKLCGIFYYFNIERNYDVLKSKSSCILLNKNINFNKIETESKIENPTHSLKETNLSFVSYKNRKFKVKLR